VTISRGVNGFTRARHLRRCHAHGATPGLRPANRRQLRFSLQDLEPGPDSYCVQNHVGDWYAWTTGPNEPIDGGTEGHC